MPIKLTADLRLLYGYGLWPRMLCRLTFVYSELQDIHSQATAFSFHTVLKNTAMCLYRNIALRFNAAIYKAAQQLHKEYTGYDERHRKSIDEFKPVNYDFGHVHGYDGCYNAARYSGGNHIYYFAFELSQRFLIVNEILTERIERFFLRFPRSDD